MDDIEHMCYSGQSIIGVDKTLNLCDMHVTASCYKRMVVVVEKTMELPMFLGPIFIHNNSDFQRISNFYNHIRIKLINEGTEELVFGTDEEEALVNSIKTAFPESGHVLCIHLKSNIKQKMIDDGIIIRQNIW